MWQSLSEEIADEFYQSHVLDPSMMEAHGREGLSAGHHVIQTWDFRLSTPRVQNLRARRRKAGLCRSCTTPLSERSKVYCDAHLRARALTRPSRAMEKRMESTSEVIKKKLPDDREGKRVHFKILVREEQEDRSTKVREADGYLTMNLMPDGKSLREIFVTVGKAGSSDAMYDEWAKQVSNRLQEGATIEQVFKPHRGTIFGDHGYLAMPIDGIRQCSSVLDLISQIVLGRFGATEAA